MMDDSPLFLDIARHALEAAGYEVVTALDLAGLEQARSRPVDLILMDVQMPEAFGDDIGMTLRFAHDITTPIYLLSGLEEKDLAERATEAQIDGYISKSQGIESMVSEVRRILPPTPT